ncbi:MAG: hypothetical protein BEN19_05175 [Epulopiscium sp. Nuni2H_MBin003]|nr:MAG: hypothetical protein BEN19_05175 [Epulopiscium sp. Nuni2H_MBin003]
MLIEKLPYIGLFLIAVGVGLIFLSIFKIAHIRSLIAINESINMPRRTRKEIFKQTLEESNRKLDSHLYPEDIGGTSDQQIINLSKKGLTTTQIAKKLNRGKGEIELILSLNKRSKL